MDPSVSGISGDMLLCALVDLGADRSRILSGVEAARGRIPGGADIRRLDFVRGERRGVSATCLALDVREDASERRGTEVRGCIEDALPEIPLSGRAGVFALACVDTLVGAESRVHGVGADSVHLHEASSMDTVVDILGCAIALDDLGLLGGGDGEGEEVISTPVAVGGGAVDFSHGTHSNPAPAILEIFRGSCIRIRGGGIGEELTTPTGACLLANLATSCREFYPTMRVSSVGYGGGSKDFGSHPNVLKVVRGSPGGASGGGGGAVQTDSVAVLETNVDDVSGEVIGGLIGRLSDGGAKDVTVSNAITKKNRPTNLVTVICAEGDADRLAGLLAAETGTLGIRMRRTDRMVRPREIVSSRITVRGVDFKVRVKADPATRRVLKVEFDDVKAVSEALGVPLRDAEILVRGAVGAGGADGQEQG